MSLSTVGVQSDQKMHLDARLGFVWPTPESRKRCQRCLYDEFTPAISFDDKGVCNYCRVHDEFEKEYPTGEEGERRLQQIAQKIREAGKGKKYDCIVGVSGGCDSSYMLLKAKELGLRPLAAHFDNTWNSAIATENIRRVLKALDVDLFTIVVNNREYDDLYASFFKSGVTDLEIPTDIGLAATLYKAAEKYGIHYVLEGHSFRTEGIAPLGWTYMDGKYIQSVHKQFGTQSLKTYPNMLFFNFMKWTVLRRIRKIRPLYFMDYHKESAKKLMSENYGWQWYGGHHLENRFTAFYHSFYLPRRTGADTRLLGYAALVRSGQMTREEGIELIRKPPAYDMELVELVKKRLKFSEDELVRLMRAPVKSYKDYKTYKPLFERLRPLFWMLYKMDLVPKSFYQKYTSKSEV